MTIQEALNEIRSKPKWYFVTDDKGDLIPHPRLIQTAQKIEDGRAKPATIKKFFETFGYELVIDMNLDKA